MEMTSREKLYMATMIDTFRKELGVKEIELNATSYDEDSEQGIKIEKIDVSNLSSEHTVTL